MTRLRHMILAGLIAWAGAAAAQEAETLPYRLAGTMAAGDATLAMIEMPDGRYRKVRIGDRFEEGTILEISNQRVVVGFDDDKRWLLKLTGGEVELPATDDETIREGTKLTRTADFDALLRKMKRTQSKAGGGQMAEPGAAVRAVLGLPVQARVLAVDGTPIGSLVQLAEIVRESLEKKYGMLISVAGVKGIDEIYLTPRLDAESTSSAD